MADDVTLSLRTRGARQAAKDVHGVADSLSDLDKAAGRFVDKTGRMREANGRFVQGIGKSKQATDGFSLSLGGLRRQLRTAGGNLRDMASSGLSVITRDARWAGLALGGLGGLGVKAGLQFNASMEQNQVAFTNLLHGEQAARRELGFLTRLAADSPFERLQITSVARQLLTANMGLKQTNSWLNTLADTAAGAGLGAEGIDRLTLAIAQIRSAGVLQGDELRQLGELGVIDRQKLAHDLGLTTRELLGGNANVTAGRGLRAIKKQLDDAFGGQRSKQAQTFNGQLSTLHDNVQMLLGAVTKPGFDALRKNVFPALNEATTEIDKIAARKDIDLGEKITLSRAVLRRRLKPFVDEAGNAIDELHLGQRLSDEFEAKAPEIADTAGRLGVKAAGAFAHAWWDAGPWGKLVTAGFLGAKLGLLGPATSGAFGWAGKKAAGQFRKAWQTRLGRLPAPVSIGGGAAAGAAEGAAAAGAASAAGSAAKGGVAGKLLRFGKVGGPLIAAGVTAGDMLANPDDASADDGRAAFLDAVRRQRREARPRTRQAPRRRDDHRPIVLQIDGKTVTRVVNRHNSDRDARGNRRDR